MKTAIEIANPIARFRRRFNEALRRIPLWKEMNELSLVIAGPIRRLAAYALQRVPWLDRVDWLLDTRSLTRRAPIAIALPTLLCAWRGITPSPLGHIGTDVALYPLVAATSSFNPFLAICCALSFGTTDLIQKFLFNDIYGADSRLSLNYWGAVLGYVLAYSAVIAMALASGITARLFRAAMIKLAYAASSADGADLGRSPSLAQEIAAMAGSFAGAATTMYVGAPILEWPAFHLRPDPDVSCYQAEVAGLHAAAPASGAAGALGAALGPEPPPDWPPDTPHRPTGRVTLARRFEDEEESALLQPEGAVKLLRRLNDDAFEAEMAAWDAAMRERIGIHGLQLLGDLADLFGAKAVKRAADYAEGTIDGLDAYEAKLDGDPYAALVAAMETGNALLPSNPASALFRAMDVLETMLIADGVSPSTVTAIKSNAAREAIGLLHPVRYTEQVAQAVAQLLSGSTSRTGR